MKYLNTFICIFIIHFPLSNAQFLDIFTGERLRFDYAVAGNDTSMAIYNHSFHKEPFWGGSIKNLIDTCKYGEMMIEVYDSASGRLIYSRGYSTLFKEWQTVGEAKTSQRVFFESVIMPFPRNTVSIILYERNTMLKFEEVYSIYYNPSDPNTDVLKQPAVSVVKIIKRTGEPGERTDIVFISEGYTARQRKKFFTDAARYNEIVCSWAPYSAYCTLFNMYAVFIPSEDAGTDDSRMGQWVSTALESNLNTFGSERYLTVSDIPRLRNCVSGIPYDQLCIIVNSNIYGGGGIYNLFTAFTADNEFSEFLFHHEFGHAYASLADEYYTSSVAYEDVYDLDVEPYEPNITTCIAFTEKWERMIADTIPRPTTDSIAYKNAVGLFEGAGYNAKGIYRPAWDCSMKSKINNSFCPVCNKAIINMIRFYGNDDQ